MREGQYRSFLYHLRAVCIGPAFGFVQVLNLPCLRLLFAVISVHVGQAGNTK